MSAEDSAEENDSHVRVRSGMIIYNVESWVEVRWGHRALSYWPGAGMVYRVDHSIWGFVHKSDAMEFKLVWG